MKSPAGGMCVQHLRLLCFVALFLKATSLFTRRVQLEPTLEEIPGGTRAIWQIPTSPEAILFVAHGLNHGPEVFWDPSASCPACTGLPEERLITMTALSRGYAVVTVAAILRIGWDKRLDLEVNVDFLQVTAFLRSWRERHGLTDLPLTAFGLSRGGDFVSLLPLGEKVEGIVLMVSSGNEEALEAASRGGGGLWPYPPALFIYMPKDNYTADDVKEHTALLSNKGLVAKDLPCYPFPVYRTFFSDRITGLSVALSKSIVHALSAKGYLTEDGYISQPDPVSWETYGHWDWARVVRILRVLPYEGNDTWTWAEEVAEEISLSFGFHCCSGLKSVQLLDWLDKSWQLPSPAQNPQLIYAD